MADITLMKWLFASEHNPQDILINLAEILLKQGGEAAHDFINATPELTLNLKLDKMLRAGHQMMFVSYQQTSYVFKRFSDTQTHSLGRRLEFFLLNLLRDPAVKSYKGAKLLEDAGVPAIKPVACVTSWQGFNRQGVFVYFEQKADSTLSEWYGENQGNPIQREVFIQLAKLVKKMDQFHLKQTDFTMRNVLISSEASNPHLFSLHLIDTDEVFKMRLDWLPRKLRLRIKLWSLRRLRPDEAMSRLFLQTYLGPDYSESVFNRWISLKKSSSNPFKTLRKKMKNSR